MIVSSVNLSLAKMVSIQGVVNAVAIASRILKNLLKQSQRKRSMSPNGKKGTKTRIMLNAVDGMKEIWTERGKKLSKLPENILVQTMAEEKQMNEQLDGMKKIQKSEECMIEQCMQSKRGNSFDLINAHNVKNHVFLMLITKIIQSHMKSFGYALLVISTYIMDQNITVREQARKLRKGMRCSDPLTKAMETCRNDMSANLSCWLSSNRVWQAGGKARFIYLPPGYNNDPYFIKNQAFADLKSSLIVLKTLTGDAEGNKVQAAERWAA